MVPRVRGGAQRSSSAGSGAALIPHSGSFKLLDQIFEEYVSEIM